MRGTVLNDPAFRFGDGNGDWGQVSEIHEAASQGGTGFSMQLTLRGYNGHAQRGPLPRRAWHPRWFGRVGHATPRSFVAHHKDEEKAFRDKCA